MSPDAEIRQLVELARVQRSSAPPLAAALADVLALTYGWRAGDGRHVTWREAARRGYAACGEAAAYLAAAAARDGRHVALELVTGDPRTCGPGYRHALAVVDGTPLDPYAARACPAPRVPLRAATLDDDNGGSAMWTTGETCGCRAAGVTTYQQAVAAICSAPGMAEVMRLARELLAVVPLEEAAHTANELAASLGLGVKRRDLEAVFDALDGVLSMCDARAAGWQADTLRGTATAIDVVSQAAPALHAAGVAIGASGLLVEVVGVAATATIGAVIVAVVGLCQILEATGVTDSMREAAAELDAEEAGGGGGSGDGGTFRGLPTLPDHVADRLRDHGGLVEIVRGGTGKPEGADWLAWLGLGGTVLGIIVTALRR